MKKKSLLLLIPTFIIIFFTAIYLYLCNQVKPVSAETSEAVRFEVPYGASTKSIINELKAQNLIKDVNVSYLVIKYPQIIKFLYPLKNTQTNFSLKSGTYNLNANMNIAQIFSELSSGRQEYQKVVIPEGLTISSIAQILQENEICNKEDFIKSCSSKEILNKFKIPAETCEGYLFPNTYFLNINMNSDIVVELFINTFFENIKSITNLGNKNAADLHQTVILASIVEKEYKLKEEAPLIASVFKNRLKHNIGLYSCATIVYIITEIQGKPHPERILTKDTKIDSPYNTYKWAGLTPGPISNPGLTALDAATNTPKTPYFFFQVENEKTGKHVFTETFEEHKINH